MKYIKDYKDGDRVFDIYFCKYMSLFIVIFLNFTAFYIF